ncbi:MBL fold metallo-hydrolase [Megamonas funiformis]|uniref:MBL fold metallo-hydrolase n=1 Tax=Megamonas funiformis TaxID=437897 RepID=UPI002FDED222
MSMSFDELSYKLEPILTKEPYWTDDNLVFLSEIPTKFPFERIKVEEVFKDNQWQDDLNFDDSAMVYKGKDGLVIITACSHSGICNIIEYSKSLFPNTKIHSIIGGFHLLKVDNKLRKTIDYLKEQDIDIIYPAHCTCLQAKIQMAKYRNIQEVGVNLKLEFK